MASSPTSSRPAKLAKMDDSIDIVHATTGTSSIPSYRPDAKERRYDRQLRLWASSGQRSLEAARVLLVGCDAAGCQTLKNLVLPGVAHFTILSALSATPQDVATNFFLHPKAVGGSLAEEAVSLLKELNPAVEGIARIEDPAELLQRAPSFFQSFTIVIASNLAANVELAIADLLWNHDIPLISLKSSGFIGRIELQFREHCVADTHPESTHTLRIDRPFPALEKYAKELDLDSMDSMEHSHVPWVVLLVRARNIWLQSHANPPSDEAEKKAFKDLIESMRSKADEENFDEAVAQAYRAWQTSALDEELASLLQDESVQKVSSDSKNLHILLNTLIEYLLTSPLPPLSPTLPDMHSSTTSYIALQSLFKAQYQDDLDRFQNLLSAKLRKLGLIDAIAPAEVEAFVKNTGGVAIVKGTRLAARREITPLEGEIGALYTATVATDLFDLKTGRLPNTPEEVSNIIPGVDREAISEVVRGGFACLPTTAAFLGGIAAQEAIKLVTNQYMPLNNSLIVNLIKSEMEKFTL